MVTQKTNDELAVLWAVLFGPTHVHDTTCMGNEFVSVSVTVAADSYVANVKPLLRALQMYVSERTGHGAWCGQTPADAPNAGVWAEFCREFVERHHVSKLWGPLQRMTMECMPSSAGDMLFVATGTFDQDAGEEPCELVDPVSAWHAMRAMPSH